MNELWVTQDLAEEVGGESVHPHRAAAARMGSLTGDCISGGMQGSLHLNM